MMVLGGCSWGTVLGGVVLDVRVLAVLGVYALLFWGLRWRVRLLWFLAGVWVCDFGFCLRIWRSRVSWFSMLFFVGCNVGIIGFGICVVCWVWCRMVVIASCGNLI